MKKLFCVFGLFLSLSTMAASIGKIEIKGLDLYPNKYVSLYVVSAQKLFGSDPTINLVYRYLGTVKISATTVAKEKQRVDENWDAFSKPNFILAVVHQEPMLALNRYPVTSGKFELALFEDETEFVEPTDTNKKELARKYQTIVSLDDLSKDSSFDFSK